MQTLAVKIVGCYDGKIKAIEWIGLECREMGWDGCGTYWTPTEAVDAGLVDSPPIHLGYAEYAYIRGGGL